MILRRGAGKVSGIMGMNAKRTHPRFNYVTHSDQRQNVWNGLLRFENVLCFSCLIGDNDIVRSVKCCHRGNDLHNEFVCWVTISTVYNTVRQP